MRNLDTGKDQILAGQKETEMMMHLVVIEVVKGEAGSVSEGEVT